jgi:hypothetical protein
VGVSGSVPRGYPPPQPSPARGEGEESASTVALQQCFPVTLLTGNGICGGFSILVPRMQGWEQRESRASLEITREETCVN